MKQGRIHGNPVMDGWAGAAMRNRSEFKNVTDLTYQPTRQGEVACPRLKRVRNQTLVDVLTCKCFIVHQNVCILVLKWV